MSTFEKSFKFRSPINSENSFGSTNLANDVESEITVNIDRETGKGGVEWNVDELEITTGGGLWFEGNELVDYDGVFELPAPLIEFLKNEGFNMDYVS